MLDLVEGILLEFVERQRLIDQGEVWKSWKTTRAEQAARYRAEHRAELNAKKRVAQCAEIRRRLLAGERPNSRRAPTRWIAVAKELGIDLKKPSAA